MRMIRSLVRHATQESNRIRNWCRNMIGNYCEVVCGRVILFKVSLVLLFIGNSRICTLVATEDIKASPENPVELWCSYGSYYWKNGM
jgi:hypothetical protein